MDITSSSFSLNETINEVLEFLERDIEYKNIHMGLQLAPDIPEIRSDKGQIQQVFLNIVKNAIDAVEAGGAIDISTTVKAEQAVVVSIKDNGPGIPEDVIKQIFEPFFTTKAKGKGTGLGLSITYGITRNLGGNIFVKSEVGKGTTFIVEMPVNSNTLAGE
jgi:two-component system NtrC family sensor kinase